MKAEEKLAELGIELPEPPTPVAAYIPYSRSGNLIFISGQDCRVNGELKYKGKVGRDVTEEQAYEAARIAAINLLAILKTAVGDLDKVKKIVNVHGYVNSAEGFVRQPMVINGLQSCWLRSLENEVSIPDAHYLVTSSLRYTCRGGDDC